MTADGRPPPPTARGATSSARQAPASELLRTKLQATHLLRCRVRDPPQCMFLQEAARTTFGQWGSEEGKGCKGHER